MNTHRTTCLQCAEVDKLVLLPFILSGKGQGVPDRPSTCLQDRASVGNRTSLPAPFCFPIPSLGFKS